MSAATIAEMLNCEHNITISPRCIQPYVQQGRTGEAPPDGCGPPKPAALCPDAFKLLLSAFESHLQLNQLNHEGDKNRMSYLLNTIQQVPKPLQIPGCGIIGKLLQHVKMDTKCQVALTAAMEGRRSKLTTYSNLKVWFDRWKQDLMKLKFGGEDREGNLVIPNNQLARIFNINETGLSLDGADGQCDGRPAVQFFDPNLPWHSKELQNKALPLH